MRKILLILTFFCVWLSLKPLMAQADCGWFINGSCTDVSTCKQADNVKSCSGQAPTGFNPVSCCCCAETLGCCEKTSKTDTSNKKTMNSTVAECYVNGTWATLKWYEGQIATPNTCKPKCAWIVGSGGSTCKNAGYTIDASLPTCKNFGLRDPNINEVCCCLPDPVKTLPTIPEPTITNQPITTALPDKILPNPLGPQNMTIGDVPKIVGKVINALLTVLGAIALLVIIYGGFLWMTSAGNETQVTKGKQTLLWAAVAIAIIFLAWMLVAFLFQALGV